MGKISVSEQLGKLYKAPRGRPPKTQIITINNSSMNFIKPVDQFNVDGSNLAESWKNFKQNFDIFMLATESVNKPDNIKIAIFLNAIGPEAVKIFNTFNLTEEDKTLYSAVIESFENFCKPKVNELYESFICENRKQQSGEPFDSFLMDLKRMIGLCGYENESRMLRDRIVFGVSDKMLQKRYFEVEKLDLKQAIDMGRATEATKQQLITVQNPSISNIDIHVINNKQRESNTATTWMPGLNNKDKFIDKSKVKWDKSNNSNINYNFRNNFRKNKIREKTCSYCAQFHIKGKCPAFGKNCLNCGKSNHFAQACLVKRVREIKINSSEISSDTLYIDTIKTENEKKPLAWYQLVRVGDVVINFKLDSGAEANILPYYYFKKLKNVSLEECQVKIEAYGGVNVRVIGSIEIVCMIKNDIKIIKFLVVDVNTIPILGLQACEDFQLIKRIQTVSIHNEDLILKKFWDNFTGLGCFVEALNLELIENAEPVVKPPRRIPLKLIEPLKKELSKLCERDIIQHVEEPVDWVSNMVIVEKSNKKLRICLDPKNLNAALKCEKFLIPSFDEITSKLANKKYFSVLDLKDGYWQIKLSDATSKLCTFSTPYGNYRFKRLPFGLKVAPEIFQKSNQKNFEDIEGVVVYIDDLLIAAKTKEEHDKIFEKVMERAREKKIKFNPDKLQFRVNSVKFLGHIIGEDGIACDPERMKAIEKIKQPQSKKELQTILGMINYVRSFIPNLAEISNPLRNLLKKNIVFQWLDCHSKILEKIKQLIMQAPTLKTFDTNKDVQIQTDSSKYGMGCCIMQDKKPVGFASRSLNNAEVNYSQIEKEMLAICFACKKYHNWIYGKNVQIITDHKPLIGIMKKDISKIPSAKLQRMRLRLLNYNLELEFMPGKYLFIADLLSRNYDNDVKSTEIEDLKEVVHTINVSDEKKKRFIQETEKDPILNRLKTILLEGWPKEKRNLPQDVAWYWKFKNDITLDDGLIFFDERLIVPQSMREVMLTELHKGHQGIERTKSRAKSLLYWPGINNEIEDKVTKCKLCQKLRNANRKETLNCHEIPQLPFYKVGMDIAEDNGKCYLVVIDYFSKYLDIVLLRSKKAQDIIIKLKHIFEIHGIPTEIVSDNQPFNSYQFKEFCKSVDIKLTTTSPTYPQANGMAERAVQTAKRLLRKSRESKEELWIALLEYRNTPLKDIELSPNELLMGRQTRSVIPGSTKHFISKSYPDLTKNFEKKNRKMRKYYNPLQKKKENEFMKGEEVWLRNGKMWWPAMIEGKHNTPRSYWVRLKETGQVVRRNSRFLRHA